MSRQVVIIDTRKREEIATYPNIIAIPNFIREHERKEVQI